MGFSLGQEEFRSLYERCAPVVFRRALALLGREADAWDVVQDVFSRLLEEDESFRDEEHPVAWAFRVTTNIALNLLRRRGVRERHLEAVQAEPALEPRVAEAREFLSALCAQLNDRCWKVAVLHLLDGMTQDEIAGVLGISRKTVVRDLHALRVAASNMSSSPTEVLNG
jgi:RNA polymerase sigma-70 factor (ECF subfamily)